MSDPRSTLPPRPRRLLGAWVAILITLGSAACTAGDSEGPSDSSAESQLVQRLEELPGVDEATVEADEFDSESTWTTVQVLMEEGPSPDDVAGAVEAVRDARADFSDYSGAVRLAEADGDALVEADDATEAEATDQARWLLGAAAAVPDAAVEVSGDRVTVTTPTPTTASVAATAEDLSEADDLAGVTVQVQTADPYADEEGAPVVTVSGRHDDLSGLPGIAEEALATLTDARPTVSVAQVSVSGSTTTPTVTARLVETDFSGATPSAAQHRADLWPAVRDLLDLMLTADHPFRLVVEAGPRHSSGVPFIDVRTDTARPTYAMGPGWRRLVTTYVRSHRP